MVTNGISILHQLVWQDFWTINSSGFPIEKAKNCLKKTTVRNSAGRTKGEVDSRSSTSTWDDDDDDDDGDDDDDDDGDDGDGDDDDDDGDDDDDDEHGHGGGCHMIRLELRGNINLFDQGISRPD